MSTTEERLAAVETDQTEQLRLLENQRRITSELITRSEETNNILVRVDVQIKHIAEQLGILSQFQGVFTDRLTEHERNGHDPDQT